MRLHDVRHAERARTERGDVRVAFRRARRRGRGRAPRHLVLSAALAQPLLRAGVAKLLRGVAASTDCARVALRVADGVLRSLVESNESRRRGARHAD